MKPHDDLIKIDDPHHDELKLQQQRKATDEEKADEADGGNFSLSGFGGDTVQSVTFQKPSYAHLEKFDVKSEASSDYEVMNKES